MTGDGLEHAQREVAQPVRGVGQAPLLQQADVRVDADAQRAVVVHGGRQTRPEGRVRRHERGGAHAIAPGVGRLDSASAVMCSWSDWTSNGPARTASIAWTAAESCWMVVTIALSAAVVAARIS